jgi:hypothetical protein
VAQKASAINWNTVMTKINGGTPLTVTEAQQVIGFFSLASTELNKPGQGFLANANAGLSFSVSSVTVFANNFTYMNLDPVGDDTNLGVNSGPSAITNTVGSVFLGAPTNSTLAGNIASQSWWVAGAGNAALQANNFVYLAEQGGVNTADPEIQQSIMVMAQNLAGGTATVKNNGTGVIISGLIVNEIGASYSKEIPDVIGQSFSVGGNFKIMSGQTYFNYIKYSSLEGTDKLMKNDSKENTKASTTFGIDVGVLVSFSDMFRGGLVIRNLNSPKFAYAGAGDITLDPQVRAGVAMKLSSLLTLAADYDVTKNKSSLLKGYESQMFGMGAEVNLIGALKLRVGTVQNMASKESSSALTYGLGLNLILLDLDLGGTLANNKVQVEQDGTEIPARAGFSGALSFRF